MNMNILPNHINPLGNKIYTGQNNFNLNQNQMNQMGQIGQMGQMGIGQIGQMGQMNTMNPMIPMNPMNQMNPMNPMNQMNPMFQMNNMKNIWTTKFIITAKKSLDIVINIFGCWRIEKKWMKKPFLSKR